MRAHPINVGLAHCSLILLFCRRWLFSMALCAMGRFCSTGLISSWFILSIFLVLRLHLFHSFLVSLNLVHHLLPNFRIGDKVATIIHIFGQVVPILIGILISISKSVLLQYWNCFQDLIKALAGHPVHMLNKTSDI